MLLRVNTSLLNLDQSDGTIHPTSQNYNGLPTMLKEGFVSFAMNPGYRIEGEKVIIEISSMILTLQDLKLEVSDIIQDRAAGKNVQINVFVDTLLLQSKVVLESVYKNL